MILNAVQGVDRGDLKWIGGFFGSFRGRLDTAFLSMPEKKPTACKECIHNASNFQNNLRAIRKAKRSGRKVESQAGRQVKSNETTSCGASRRESADWRKDMKRFTVLTILLVGLALVFIDSAAAGRNEADSGSLVERSIQSSKESGNPNFHMMNDMAASDGMMDHGENARGYYDRGNGAYSQGTSEHRDSVEQSKEYGGRW